MKKHSGKCRQIFIGGIQCFAKICDIIHFLNIVHHQGALNHFVAIRTTTKALATIHERNWGRRYNLDCNSDEFNFIGNLGFLIKLNPNNVCKNRYQTHNGTSRYEPRLLLHGYGLPSCVTGDQAWHGVDEKEFSKEDNY